MKLKLLFLLVLLVSAFFVFKLISTRAQTFDGKVFLSGTDLFLSSIETYNIKIDSGTKKVGFVSVEINFDQTKLTVGQEITTSDLFKTKILETTAADANQTGKITLVLGVSPADVQNAPSGEFEVASIVFNRLANSNSQPTELTINPDSLQVVDMESNELALSLENKTISFFVPTETQTPTLTPTETFIPTAEPTLSPSISPTSSPPLTPTVTAVPTTTPTTVTFTPSPTVTPTSTPTLTPTNSPMPTLTPTVTSTQSPSPTPTVSPTATLSMIQKGELFKGVEGQIEIYLNTNGFEVVGTDVVISYPSDKIEILSVENNSLFNGNFTSSLNTSGLIRISATQNPQQTFMGDGTFAIINAKPKVTGDIPLDFEFVPNSKAESNVISLNGSDILSEPEGLIIQSVNQIFLWLNLKTASEGAEGYKVSGNVKLDDGIWNQNFTTDFSGNAGPWDLDSNLSGTNVPFLIKVPGFLKRRVSLDITSGDNYLNGGLLSAGDLNDDGIVNNIDLAIMYADWFGSSIADYNRDGIVNTYDFWILTANFFKTDE